MQSEYPELSEHIEVKHFSLWKKTCTQEKKNKDAAPSDVCRAKLLSLEHGTSEMGGWTPK